MATHHPQSSRARRLPTLGLDGFGWNVSTVLGIFSILVTIYIAVVQREVKSNVQELTASALFKILSPPTGSGVGPSEFIRGTTPFRALKHYVVVHPDIGNQDWVQKRASVYPTGNWTGPAIFGDASSRNQTFTVRCIATKTDLPPGPLGEIPEDAQFSSAISVTRTR